MTEVTEGDTITLHYTGSLDDGTIFDSSEGRPPMSFKVGAGQVIPGFDDGVRAHVHCGVWLRTQRSGNRNSTGRLC